MEAKLLQTAASLRTFFVLVISAEALKSLVAFLEVFLSAGCLTRDSRRRRTRDNSAISVASEWMLWNNTVGVPTLSSLEPGSTPSGYAPNILAFFGRGSQCELQKAFRQQLREAAAVGRLETDWKAQVKYTVFLGSAEFVARTRKLLRGDRDQQTGVRHERLKH